MTGNNHNSEFEMHGLLERLVAGELDETDRALVVDWLDADAGRWRLCGLAFLEAQTWSETLGGWTSEPTSGRAATVSPIAVQRPQERRVHTRMRTAVLALGLLIAFTAGLMARGMLASPGTNHVLPDAEVVENRPPGPGANTVETAAPDEPLMATVSLPPGAPGIPAAEVRFPVVKGDVLGPDRRPVLPQIPDSVRRQWERQGYQFDAERRFLLARLPDGEQVAVPIERLLVSYVGNKVY
jgi:hypothetical protein